MNSLLEGIRLQVCKAAGICRTKATQFCLVKCTILNSSEEPLVKQFCLVSLFAQTNLSQKFC